MLVKCRKCGTYLVARSSGKSKKCTGCGHVNVLRKVVLVKRFPSSEEAMDALRYVKVPRALRGEVPYAASGFAHGRGSMKDEARARARAFVASMKEPVSEDALVVMAGERGIDLEELHRIMERGKAEGSIIVKAGGKLVFR